MTNLSHDEAIDALCGCAATVTVLSYKEAIEGYFALRGLAIPEALSTPAPTTTAEGAFEAALVARADRAAQAWRKHPGGTAPDLGELLVSFAKSEARLSQAAAERPRAGGTMREALEQAAMQFRIYEASHRAKASDDGDAKAERNRQMAEMCEAALASADQAKAVTPPAAQEGYTRGLAAAYDAARGTNADMCKNSGATYRLMLEAIRKLQNNAALRAQEGAKG